MANALIIVDVQHDFLPGGSLGVKDGDAILPTINKIAPNYDYLIATMDWHPADHFSFSENPEFKDGSWPSHCVQDTPGAELHPDIPKLGLDAVFRKGYITTVEAYSGFDGSEFEKAFKLDEWLKEHDVTEVHVVGLAFDYCVKATALSAHDHGYETHLLFDATAAVDPSGNDDLIADLTDMGVFVTHSDWAAPEKAQ